jgi:hypothetical protein
MNAGGSKGGGADDNAVTKAWGVVAARHDVLH